LGTITGKYPVLGCSTGKYPVLGCSTGKYPVLGGIMTERASIFEAVQIGVETTPGTAVAAAKRMQGLTVTPGIKSSISTYKGSGFKFPTISTMGKEWVEAGVSGPMSYTDLVYILSGIMGTAAIVDGGGGVYTWTFTPKLYSGDTPKTYTIETGSVLRAQRFAYGLLTGGTLQINRDECTFSASMIAHALEDDVYLSTNAKYSIVKSGDATGGTFTLTVGAATTSAIAYDANAATVQAAIEALATVGTGNVVCTGGALPSTAVVATFVNDLAQTAVTMTIDTTNITGGGSMTITATAVGAAPAVVDLVPVTSPEVLVYVASTQAGLAGATALARNFAVSVALNSRFGPVWVLNGSRNFAAHVETAPDLSASLLVEADDEGMAQLPKMRTGDTLWVRVKATSPTMVAGTTPYSMQIDMATKITDAADFSDEDGVYAIEWTLTGVSDPTWGKAIQTTIVNDLSAL